MMRPILKGSTDQSVVIRIVDSTDGTPETGVVYNTSGIDLWYRRELEAKTSITEATLAALTTAHADGGFLHIGDGYYRLDLPDAAVASGANGVMVGGTVTGMVVIGCYVPLYSVNPYDSVRYGLTALPNAAADAAGGLVISDAGGLDADAQRADVAAILVDTGTTLDGRIPAALVGGRIDANVGAISSDATAADNAEAFFDGTGYAGTGNVIPTVTTLTNAPSDSSGITTLLSRLSSARAGYLDNLSAGAVALQSTLTTVAGYIDTEVQTVLDRLGAFTGSGVNTVLGFFKAIMRKDASNPSDLGGTYDAATDSLEFLQEDGAQLRDFGIMQVTTIATLASQTSFTLTAGSANDDAYNGCPIMITDSATEEQKCGGIVDDYTGSTKTVALKWDPAIFTMAVGDNVTIKLATDAPGFKKGKALANFEFVMIDSTDDISGKTGVTVTAERSIDGAAFGACTNSPAEVANGVYKIALSAADLAGNVITLKFTGTGCNATLITLVTEP